MNPDRFEIPSPPPGLRFPDLPGVIGTSIIWAIVAGFLVYALWHWKKTRSPLALLLFIGGGIASINEPIVDLLALCWQPRLNNMIVFETIGPVPLWCLGTYFIFFGGATHLALQQAERGITRKSFWIAVLGFFALDIALELPMLHYGYYYYYGEPPFNFLGFPVYWTAINTTGTLIDVAILLRARSFFTGWRLGLVPLLPMLTDAGGSVLTGWPIMTALNTPGASEALKWGAGGLTLVIGLLVFDALSRVVCVDGVRSRTSTAEPGTVSPLAARG